MQSSDLDLNSFASIVQDGYGLQEARAVLALCAKATAIWELSKPSVVIPLELMEDVFERSPDSIGWATVAIEMNAVQSIHHDALSEAAEKAGASRFPVFKWEDDKGITLDFCLTKRAMMKEALRECTNAIREARRADEPKAPKRLKRFTVTPVREIPADTKNEKMRDAVGDIADDYAILTKPLDLHGPDELLVPGGDQVVSGIAMLRRKAPWMEEVIDRIEEQVETMSLLNRPWVSLEPLLICGPSGAGKTYFAKLAAEALSLKFAGQSLAGVTDNRLLEGTSRGWSNKVPSWPVTVIAMKESGNPLLFLDELDKVEAGRGGDPLETILPMLDQENSRAYYDRCLTTDVNLGYVSWLFAANEVQGLNTAFLDRIEIIEVKEPGCEHLPQILENIIDDFAARLSVDRAAFGEVTDFDLSRFEKAYREGRSIRALGREMNRHLLRNLKRTSAEGRLHCQGEIIAKPESLEPTVEDDFELLRRFSSDADLPF